MPIRFKYGEFSYFGREFVREILTMLMLRSIDMVLMFDYDGVIQ